MSYFGSQRPAGYLGIANDGFVKQRITRILIHEIIANVDEQAQEVVLVIHWAGGRHSERGYSTHIEPHRPQNRSWQHLE